jgi:hypothetical protein
MTLLGFKTILYKKCRSGKNSEGPAENSWVLDLYPAKWKQISKSLCSVNLVSSLIGIEEVRTWGPALLEKFISSCLCFSYSTKLLYFFYFFLCNNFVLDFLINKQIITFFVNQLRNRNPCFLPFSANPPTFFLVTNFRKQKSWKKKLQATEH